MCNRQGRKLLCSGLWGWQGAGLGWASVITAILSCRTTTSSLHGFYKYGIRCPLQVAQVSLWQTFAVSRPDMLDMADFSSAHYVHSSAHYVHCMRLCSLNYCRLGDVLRQAAVVCMDPSWQRHLMAMTGYAAAARDCRRALLAAHFAEGPPACSGMCDLCLAAAAGAGDSQNRAAAKQQREEEDITAAALCAIAALKVG